VPPPDSQSTRGSISTTTNGETICTVLSMPPPLQQPTSEQSTTNRSAAPPISGHGGSSNPILVPQFHSEPAPPRSKLRPCRYYNFPQPPGILCRSRAISDSSTSQRTISTRSTSGTTTSSTVVQPTSAAPPSPAHSSSDSGISSSPPPTTSPKIEPVYEEIRQRWNSSVKTLIAQAEALTADHVRQQARRMINDLLI
jgi:hypothetical protein